jgi:hypothetical protein
VRSHRLPGPTTPDSQLGLCDGFPAGTRLGHDVDIGLGAKNHAEALALIGDVAVYGLDWLNTNGVL